MRKTQTTPGMIRGLSFTAAAAIGIALPLFLLASSGCSRAAAQPLDAYKMIQPDDTGMDR